MQTKVSIRRKKDMSVSVSPSLVLKRVPVDLKRVHPSNKENSLILKNKTNNNNSNNNEKQQQQKKKQQPNTAFGKNSVKRLATVCVRNASYG